jgi:predicted outer membrane protein
MWKPLCFVGMVLIVAQALGQTTTPTIPQPGQPGQPQIAPAQQGQPGQVGQPAAQPGARQTANYRGPNEAERGDAQQIDRHIAACLTLGNEEEVALGKFATEHAQNSQVKQFAQQIVEAHNQAISQLKKFVPQGVSLQLSQRDEGAAERFNERTGQPGIERQGQTGAERAPAGYGAGQAQPGAGQPQPDQIQPGGPLAQAMAGAGHQLLNIEREAKQQCLAMTQDELQRQKGDEFDKCYLGQQLGAHIQMLAVLQTAERHVSPELQRVVEQQRQTAEQHLQHVRQLQQELTKAETASSNSRTPR